MDLPLFQKRGPPATRLTARTSRGGDCIEKCAGPPTSRPRRKNPCRQGGLLRRQGSVGKKSIRAHVNRPIRRPIGVGAGTLRYYCVSCFPSVLSHP
jgi:hypothetical protein